MRILEVSPYNYIRGGSDRYFLQIAGLLETNGHVVNRLCRIDPRNAPSADAAFFVPGIDPKNGGIPDALNMIYSRSAARALDRMLRAHPVDIAHLHIYYGHFSGSILSVLRRHDVPIVQTAHDYKAVCPVYTFNRHGRICEDCHGGRFWQALRHRCNRGSIARSALSMTEAYVTDALGARTAIDRVVAASRFQADRLVAHGVPARRTTVLHNPVDTDRYPSAPRRRKPDSIVYFGRIEYLKGVDTLLEAFLAIPAKLRRGFRLRFAGDGEYVDTLKGRIAAEGDGSVEYLGFIADAAADELFDSALCSVLASRWYENCPISVLESLARGVTVIGARIGGLPEIVKDGEDGLLIEPEDVAGLSAALRTLIEDPGRAIRLGEAGRARMRRDFSPAEHVTKLVGVFEDVLAERRAGAWMAD